MLRVPRGIGIVVLSVALGLIFLAYWVGHQRGTSAVQAAIAAERLAEQALYLEGGGERSPSTPDVELREEAEPSATGGHVGPAARVPLAAAGDARVAGRNYFVLARDSRAGAQRLLDFLRTHGVEAVAVSHDNGGLFKIVAMDHGFAKGEVGGGTFKRYRQQLTEVGRIWETTHRGVVSFEKQGMYAERFDDPSGPVTVITPR